MDSGRSISLDNFVLGDRGPFDGHSKSPPLRALTVSAENTIMMTWSEANLPHPRYLSNSLKKKLTNYSLG